MHGLKSWYRYQYRPAIYGIKIGAYRPFHLGYIGHNLNYFLKQL